MKKKFAKIWGIGLAVVLALSLLLAAAPVSAADPVINEWDEFAYPDTGEDGDWFWDAHIDAVGPIAEAIDGTLYAYAWVNADDDRSHDPGEDVLFKSDDVGRTWEETDYEEDLEDIPAGAIVDIACSSLDEDTLYVTDGNYVYKTDDAGDTWDYVAQASLETVLEGDITSIDVGYDDDDDPYVFMGSSDGSYGGSVYFVAESGYEVMWKDLEIWQVAGYDVYAVAASPEFADSGEVFAVVTNDAPYTAVLSNEKGTIGDWTEFAELVWNCVSVNSFGISDASRIGFPDDWEDTETLFVGVVSTGANGGDVYSVTDDGAIDRNVRPGEGGCVGDDTNIISLDVCGDTDEGSQLAGANDDTTVYYSSDGGWEWDPSEKDPTGENATYVLWVGDECGESAVAATSGCECAVSLTCISDEVEDVGESWNQISLIGTDVTCVLDIDHSPDYITGSETLFMVTMSSVVGCPETTSLFRYDGTFWDRVFCSTTYAADFPEPPVKIEMVQVSPDFLDTDTVFVANMGFDIFITEDVGCSWDRLSYPCEEINITSWAVIDEDTIYAGGDGVVYKTERHGSRPWDECELPTAAGWVRYFAFTSDAILASDDESQVFICEVDPDEDWEDQEFDLVGDCDEVLGGSNKTSVAFDPGYGVTDDEGENIIYAAAGEVIARCVIDWDEDWEDQEWDEIYDDVGSAWGMKVVGDTALYVGDEDAGMIRSLNPTEEDEEDVDFERVNEGLDSTDLSGLRQLSAGENGCTDSNVLWAVGDDGDCDEVWFYEDILATPVILASPSDGANLDVAKTDEVTLTWEALCEADEYEIDLYEYCAECPDEKLYVLEGYEFECDEDCVGCSGETCCLSLPVVDQDRDLEPGTTYYWQVRVLEGEPTVSKWSELWEFTTAMPAIPFFELCSPECGADDIIISPNFSWNSVSDATSYDVQLATNENFDPVLASGTPIANAWLGAPELDYSTTYYWRVRAVKDGVTSEWTTCIFTTVAEEVEVWVSPYTGEKFDSEEALLAHIDAWEAAHAPTTSPYIWVIIAIGALLVIAVLILIVRTRRVA
ncbi:MAG TPA: hypothetical protein G4N93_01795 [Dehalococcoidia bacterium]|nr:hypothetical protein [Dehalococcoidia bacterium]